MGKHHILWLSRHAMTAEQKTDLESVIGHCDVTSRNVVWAASTDAVADLEANSKTLHSIAMESFDVVAGVFPPVAVKAWLQNSFGVRLCSPVSAQSVEERADGEKKIVFRHLRWEFL